MGWGHTMRVLISGASIAGPALAFWLHRYGIEATLVERAPAPRPGGQAVDLRGVGKVAADRMGLLEQIRAACTDTGGLSLVDASGRRRATLTVDQFGGDGPIAEIEILRGDIARVLREATDNEYLYGDRIVLLDEQSDGVHVTFESGGCRVFDAVIGADGLHSGVRSLLFGDVPLRHLGRYLAFWTARNHLGLENWSLVHNAPGRSIGVRTINSNQAFMAFASFHADDLHHDYRDIGWQKSLARSRLSGLGWEAAEPVSQLDDAADFYFDSVSQVHLPSWSRGRVGLLGDAAFCASPRPAKAPAWPWSAATSWPASSRPRRMSQLHWLHTRTASGRGSWRTRRWAAPTRAPGRLRAPLAFACSRWACVFCRTCRSACCSARCSRC